MYKTILFILSVVLTNCQSKNQSPVMNTHDAVVELVIYKTKPGISHQEALEKAKSVNEFIKSQPGFISRRNAHTKDGQWIDLVLWESMEQAIQANQKAMQSEIAGKFFEIIEQDSMQFMHASTMFEVNK